MRAAWPAGCNLLVVDHYGRDRSFERACRGWADRIMVIDDLADRPHDCDYLLDPTLGRTREDYAELIPAASRTYLGTGFAMLSCPFAKARARAVIPRGPTVRRVLISFGASDPANATSLTLDALSRVEGDFAVTVVLGRAAPHRDVVADMAVRFDRPVDIRVGLDASAMATVMAESDLAIGAGGNSSWERCCVGLPTALIVTSDNQRIIAARLDDGGAAELLGDVADLHARGIAAGLRRLIADGDRIRGMSAAAAAVCDGHGAARIVAALVSSAKARNGQPVHLRRAETGDAALMLAWQQDPATRRYARNPRPPTSRTHARWMEARLRDPACNLNLIMHGDVPSGVLRLDRMNGEDRLEVSLLVAPDRQRLGIGKAALALARAMYPEAAIYADVHPENAASIALFRSAGYEGTGRSFTSLPTNEGRQRRHG